MTVGEFRKMALEIPTAVERSHMNHPDFRVAGKIFASLGAPDESWGMVKLTPEQQRAFIKKAPRFSNRVAAPGANRAPRMFILLPRKRALFALLSMLRRSILPHTRRRQKRSARLA
jgi:hypothetical protein